MTGNVRRAAGAHYDVAIGHNGVRPMEWTAELVISTLASAGFAVPAAGLSLEPRDGRLLARMPGDRMAWFATNDDGRHRMPIESRVLRLLEARCTFAVPRVLHEDTPRGFQVRSAVPGLAEPWRVDARAKADPRLAASLGRTLGAALAEQHLRITEQDGAGWLPTRVSWPEPLDSIRERLPRVVADAGLLRELHALLARYEAIEVAQGDRVLVHADLGLHNLAIDPETDAVRGVFDYEGAAWDDRHHDFRYLVFDFDDTSMLDAALAVYEPATGCRISRERVTLYNATAAASFLALRDGVAPEAVSCGRTLAQDLAWVRSVLDRLN